MGYVTAWVSLTVEVESQDKSTRMRTLDDVLAKAVLDPRVKGFEVTKTEKVGFFRRGRYIG